MSPFNAIGKAPGVYIDEVPVFGPIAGVGTSTAAFVGAALKGPMNQPIRLNSWSQFAETFGLLDTTKNAFDPYFTAGNIYVTHAVRGFFDNGGTDCFFVRVGTATRASRTLKDKGGQPILVVSARNEGAGGNYISIKVDDDNINDKILIFKAMATLTVAANGAATLANQAESVLFRPGDIVLVEGQIGGQSAQEQVEITAINRATIKFKNLTKNFAAGGTMRIADLVAGMTDKIRVDTVNGIETGTILHILGTYGGDPVSEYAVVQNVESVAKFITLARPLAKNYSLANTDSVALVTNEFKLFLTVKPPNAAPSTLSFDKLSMDPRHSHYFGPIVNDPRMNTIVDVVLADPPSSSIPPNNLPEALAEQNLENGTDDDVSKLDYLSFKAGVDTLTREDQVNILCVPDAKDAATRSYMIEHCEKLQDRFAILDPIRGANPALVEQQVRGDPAAGNPGLASKGGYAAIYYPWITISDPNGPGNILVPPSGHIAGLYARTDNNRGVHKAPANDGLRGALGLERVLTDEEQGLLNDAGINVIRIFPGRGITVWGGRTISTNTQWRYINVRRLLLFIEESVQEGTQFAVFEPNNLALWGKLKRQVTDFLTNIYNTGALFGATADQAFRVRVDEELNPSSLRALGQLVIEIIVVPTTPAEFIVFRVISDTTGNSLIQE